MKVLILMEKAVFWKEIHPKKPVDHDSEDLEALDYFSMMMTANPACDSWCACSSAALRLMKVPSCTR